MSTSNIFSNVFISGTVGCTTITASTQFVGPGTGLTGTAASFNVGGSAGSLSTTYTAGRILYGAGSGVPTTVSTLFYDSANGRLGIGVTNPQVLLAAVGTCTLGTGAGTTTAGYHTGMVNIIGGGTRALLRLENNNSVGSPGIIFGEGGGFTEDTQPTIKKVQGTNNLAIMCGGNVGIGTASPNTTLDVNGILTTRSDIYTTPATTTLYSNTFSFRFNDSGAGAVGTPKVIINSNGPNAGSPQTLIMGVDGAAFGQTAYLDTSTGGVSGTTPLAFRMNGSEKMRVHTNGNVGIGTATPAYALDVWGGQIRVVGNPFLVQDVSASPSVMRITTGSDGKNYIQSGTALTSGSSADLIFGTIFNASQFLTIKATTGFVGIGTTSPVAGLHCFSTTNASLTTNGSPGSGVVIGSDLDYGRFPGEYSPILHFRQSYFTAGSGSISTGGIAGYKTVANGSFGGGLAFLYCANGATTLAQGMTLTDTGRVGIGTTNPGSALHTAINSATATTIATFENLNTTTTTAKSFSLQFYGNGSGGQKDVGAITMIPTDGNFGYSAMAFSVRGPFNAGNEAVAEVMRFARSGNNTAVGIGTTNPGALFQVNAAVINPTIPTVHIGDNSNDYGATYGMVHLTRNATPGDTKAHLSIIRNGNTGVNFGFWNNTNTFGIWPNLGNTGTTPTISITTGGNVGIGVTNPGYTLDVSSFAVDGGTIRIASSSSCAFRMMEVNDSYGFSFTNVAASRMSIKRHSGSQAGSEIISILRDNPYVGIGVTNPGSALSFGQPVVNKIITLYDGNAADPVSTATSFYGFGVNGGILRYQTPDSTNVHKFYCGTSVAASITAASATFGGTLQSNNPAWNVSKWGQANQSGVITYSQTDYSRNVTIVLGSGTVQVPVSGFYQLNFHYFIDAGQAGSGGTFFRVNGNRVVARNYSSEAQAYRSGHISAVVSVAANDIFSVLSDVILHGNDNCNFSGHLIA